MFSLLSMSVVLILVVIVGVIIGTTMTPSPHLVWGMIMASSSMWVGLITLELWFVVVAILVSVILICTSLKSLVLKLPLGILGFLTFASWSKTYS